MFGLCGGLGNTHHALQSAIYNLQSHSGACMTRPSSGGRIEVICGCMFSGKTEELIRRLHHVQIARQKLRAFTPRSDTRYAVGNLVSHNGVRIEAHPVESMREVSEQSQDDVQLVALDELHFLDDDPATTLAV